MSTVHYNNLMERQQLVSANESSGLVMLHDNFDPSWTPGDEPHGTLTFVEPVPKTAEELYQEQLASEFNEIHERALLAYKNWSSLTLVQKDAILKNLVKWVLWKDGWLKLGVL